MMSTLAASKTLWRSCAVVLSMALASVDAHTTPSAHDDPELSALLKMQTQAFSEAGQKGDAATIDRYLDPEVVFTNETGAIATKKDLVEGTTPTPPGAPKRHIEVTNWSLHRQGNVATATFIDEVTQQFQGQSLVLRFQSTETWAKRASGWKMIASHTMNVQRAPEAITLPPPKLDAYVGVYQVDPTYVVTITRSGDGLEASANGGAAVPLKVEIRDVLFTPGAPNVRKIFQRDAAGHVVGYINRRDGGDLIFKKVAPADAALAVHSVPATASEASDSLLNADRALAAESHRIGFVAAYSKAMGPDARKLDSGALTLIGPGQILAQMKRYPADLTLEWTPQEAVVADSGELGFTWGYYVTTVHDRNGALVTSYGKYLDVWRRQSDGVWRWIADIGNDNPPPPFPLGAAKPSVGGTG